MNVLTNIFQDWKINSRNPKIQVLLVFFRLAHLLRQKGHLGLLLGFPIFLIYRLFFEWILGIELPWQTRVGPNLRIFHGFGLVVNDRVVLGEGVILRHLTSIGVKGTGEFGTGDVPRIGNYVDIGSHVVILGNVVVGDHAKIGAGSVVVKDVPAHAVVVGNPARVVRIEEEVKT